MILLAKYWQLAIGAVGIAILGVLLMLQKGETRHFTKLYEGEQSARQLEQAEVRRVRAEQKAADAEHARKVEQVQATVTQEVSHDYQVALADLRARYDKLRAAKAKTPPSGGSGADLPSLPSAPSRPDDAAPAGEDDFNAAANFLQLEALQKWLRDQLAVER